jgi:hypothetical protein
VCLPAYATIPVKVYEMALSKSNSTSKARFVSERVQWSQLQKVRRRRSASGERIAS